MNSDLLPGEEIIRESRAKRHTFGLGEVGGNLTLTNQRVIFEPYRITGKRGPEAFDLDNIVSVSNAWSEGNYPLPTALKITFRDGMKVRFAFAVGTRSEWREALSPKVEPAIQHTPGAHR